MAIQLVKVNGVAWGWGHLDFELKMQGQDALGTTIEKIIPSVHFTSCSHNVDFGRESVYGGGIVKINEGQGNVDITGSFGFRPDALWGDSTNAQAGGIIPKLKARFGNFLSIPPLQLRMNFGRQLSSTTDNHSILFKEVIFRTLDFPRSQGDTSFEVTMDFGAKEAVIDGMGLYSGDTLGTAEATLITTSDF